MEKEVGRIFWSPREPPSRTAVWIRGFPLLRQWQRGAGQGGWGRLWERALDWGIWAAAGP